VHQANIIIPGIAEDKHIGRLAVWPISPSVYLFVYSMLFKDIY